MGAANEITTLPNRPFLYLNNDKCHLNINNNENIEAKDEVVDSKLDLKINSANIAEENYNEINRRLYYLSDGSRCLVVNESKSRIDTRIYRESKSNDRDGYSKITAKLQDNYRGMPFEQDNERHQRDAAAQDVTRGMEFDSRTLVSHVRGFFIFLLVACASIVSGVVMCSAGVCGRRKGLVVLVIGAMLVGARSAPVDRSKRDLYADDNVQRYLMTFGYLPESNLEAGNLIMEDQLQDAIKNLQEFGGIPVTGSLDAETRALLARRRCGLPDYDFKASSSKRRTRRYVLQGSKWNHTNLTWSLTSPPSAVPAARAQDELGRALAVWAQHSRLTFTRLDAGAGTADIVVSFARGDHHDGYAFDGRGQILAHAFFPGSGRGGDAHFDDDELWLLQGSGDDAQGTSLFAVAAHEFGHSLGLSHSSVKGALMYPWYQGIKPNFQLPEDDRHGIQQMYGSKEKKLWAVIPQDLPTEPPRTTTTTTTTTTTRRPEHRWSHYHPDRRYPSNPRYPYHPRNPHEHPTETPQRHYPVRPRTPNQRPQYPEREPDYPYRPNHRPYTTQSPNVYYPKDYPRRPNNYPNRRPSTRPDRRRYPEHPRQPEETTTTTEYTPYPRNPKPEYPKKPVQKKPYYPVANPARPTRPTVPQGEKPPKPDTCDTSYDAVALIRGEVFIFKNEYLWRIGDNGLYQGYPTEISRMWSGLPRNLTHVDAVYERPDRKIVFFIGREYYLFDSNILQRGYPKPITHLLLPATLERVDAAMVWGHNGNTYFYSGTEYWKFDESIGQVELDYPRDMSMWKGVGYNIDSVFQWKDGKTYFFKGKGFWKFNDLQMKVERESQTPSGPFWMGCPPLRTDLGHKQPYNAGPPAPTGTLEPSSASQQSQHFKMVAVLVASVAVLLHSLIRI